MKHFNQNHSKLNEIRSLLLVFGGGVAFAIVLTLTLLFIYNPSGVYQAQYLLITPENLESARSNAIINQQNLELAPMEFTWIESPEKIRKSRFVELEKYRTFYHMIKNDRSLSSPGASVERLFNGPTFQLKSQLNLKSLKTNKMTETRLQVQFAPDTDYYRIPLQNQEAEEQWAYFFHPSNGTEHFSQQVFNLFTNHD